MEWPYRRFIKAFDAFQRRLACDEFRLRRTAHIAALYSNTNLDGEDSPRARIVEQVEHAYEELIVEMWNGPDPVRDAAQEAADNSPFMMASRRATGGMVLRPILPGEAAIAALPD